MQRKFWTPAKPARLAAAIVAGLLSAPVWANGDVSGRVTDVENEYFFAGALVEIKELGLKQVTDRDGSFRFNDLKNGDYNLRITYLGFKPVEYAISVKDGEIIKRNFAIADNQDVIDEVVVLGQRSSQAGALNRQKNANRITSVVSSDSIGSLPDQNAAEALQRLPGMFIQRDQGEGRFVGIRGIDPNLNNVSINGTSIPSPESGVRGVAMDVIPSELIEGLEVSKSVTPDMDADAVGGSIDIKSLSAFDRKGDSLKLKAQGSYSEHAETTSPKLSGAYTTIFDLEGDSRLGIATAVSWFEREFGSDNIETDGGWGEIKVEDLDSGDDVEGFGAEEIEQRYYQIKRERTGIAFNIDYEATANDAYYIKTLQSKFADSEFRLRNEYKFEDGAVNSATWTDTSGEFTEAKMDRDTKDRYEKQEILSIVAGGENLRDDWLFEYSVGYSKSEESEPNRLDVDFKSKKIDMGYVAGKTPTFTQSAKAHDLSNFEMDEIVNENNFTEDEEVSFKLDITKDFVWNNYNGQFKFGGKYRTREKFNDVEITIYDGGFDDVFASQFETATPDWGLGNFGPGISQSGVREFFNANQSSLEIDQNGSLVESAGASFSSEEDITALYSMVSLDLDKLHIVFGARYESTDFKTSGNKVELLVDEVNDEETVTVTPWIVEKDYDHFLPSLNIRYDVNDKFVTRFAYTNTIARPGFGDSAAFQRVEIEATEDDGVVEIERQAEVGNPDLDPYESTNLDLSFEYYPGNIGVMSAALFYKDIDNFIVQAEVQDNGEWEGFKEVVQPINGGSTELTGVELAWTKSFDSGLLLAANATFTDTTVDMPNQADKVGNFTVGYETDSFSTRLTWSHKSSSFQFEDGDAGVYQDSHNQLDLNVNYHINDDLKVYFNAINLTDEPFYLYHGSAAYNYQYEEYGSTFELGISYKAF